MKEGKQVLRLQTPGTSALVQDDRTLQAASRAFSFPFPQAYQIQIDLMQHIFRAIEDEKIGIFESPTGTGKSLSLICAAFTWLRQDAKRRLEAQTSSSVNGAEPDWVIAYEMKKRREEIMQHEEELKERVVRMRKKLQAAAEKEGKAAARKRRKKDITSEDASDSDNDYLVKEPQSHDDNRAEEDGSVYLSAEVQALLNGDNGNGSNSKLSKSSFAGHGDADIEDEEPETSPKIIYASRTHSQLSQFVSELKKTDFGKDVVVKDADDLEGTVRNVSVGSRKQMCINDKIQELGARAGMEAMNEACLELMKADKKKHCRYLPPSTEAGRLQMLEYRDAAFASVRDIEDLVDLGKKMEICPYFGSRKAARQAQLITIPYNLLLQAKARASLNISLKDSIVVIDEAHNLIDTILSIHTVTITSEQVVQAQGQIRHYAQRFATRLKGINEVNLKKLAKILESLVKQCETQIEKLDKERSKEEMISSAELVRRLGENIDQLDLIELEKWLKDTQIARKVAGYAEKREKVALQTKPHIQVSGQQSVISAMHTIEVFILSLANRSKDGRVLVSLMKTADAKRLTMKYQLLNPAEAFGEIISEARSVILAGGTMEPISDFTSQLFASVDSTRIVHHSCKHVIPSDNLMAAVVCKGSRGKDFEFKFDARNDVSLLDDLTATIAAYCNVIPHGIVVFLPSYSFLEALTLSWKNSDGLQRIASKKKVFYEPKMTTDVDSVLREYTTMASSDGAILFAVVGAKLSEGINFSDRLARAVIMVGMPFANSASAELNERMKYLRDLQKSDEGTRSATRVDAGQELYINLCMKAVNQSIGRAIRHQSDFAALILLDKRYGRADIQARLPAWIRPSVNVHATFGPSVAALGTFFRDKRARNIL